MNRPNPYRGCLESPCEPSEALPLGAGHAVRRLAGEPPQHEPTHRQIDHRFAAFREVLILFTEAAIAADPGERSFDVSTIMLSSRHCLSRLSGMTYPLEESRPSLSGATLGVGSGGRRATGPDSHRLLAGRAAVAGVPAQPHPPRRPAVCSAHASGLGATPVCATDAALSVIRLTHALGLTTATRAQAQGGVAACGADVPPGAASVPPPTGG
jgi:hypothetical protein